MFFRQYYLGCLSHASYLIGDESTGRAVVVDPQRDISQYLRDADAHGLTIERVIETHFHADFVSGHLELQAATGAVISYGPGATTEYSIENLTDGHRLDLGGVRLEVRHTPGHTPESISVVVWEHADDAELDDTEPYGVLTGDTLFIGDVGRPDLLSSKGVAAEDLAAQLYHSLHAKLLTLPDSTRVFPAHGAGSACGKQLSTETVSTIGEQRATNYALANMSVSEFVARVTEHQPAAPPYFAFDAGLNRLHREQLDENSAPPAITFAEMQQQHAAGAAIIDTRDDVEYAQGHVRGSLNVGLGGRFAEYCGDVVDPHTPIVLIGNPGTETEARVRLGRIGFDHVVGALVGGCAAFVEHPEAIEVSSRLTASELGARGTAELQVVDVRNAGETRLGMIPGAAAIPLAQLTRRLSELDPTRPTVVHCAGGYRSSLAASALRAAGFADVSDLLGGFEAWVATTQPVVQSN